MHLSNKPNEITINEYILIKMRPITFSLPLLPREELVGAEQAKRLEAGARGLSISAI